MATISVSVAKDGNASMMSDIAYKELNFRTIGPQREMMQWQMAENAVSFTAIIFQFSPMVSLAFAENLKSGSLTQTFYGSNFYCNSDPYYY